MSDCEFPPKRRRIHRTRKVRRFTARIEEREHDYLEQLCQERGEAKSAALSRALREHRQLFHVEQ
jgi:hypothetical protein